MPAPRMRQLVAFLAGAVLVAGPLAGCAARPDSAGLAARLTRAVQAHDQDDWRRATPDVPSDRRDVLWSNLEQLDRVSFQSEGLDLVVSWSVPGDAAAARQLIHAVWRCPALGCRLADLLPRPDTPAPIWLTGPIRLTHADGVTVLDGRVASAATPPSSAPVGGSAASSTGMSWGTIGQSARDGLARAGLGKLSSGWNGQLVVEVPATTAALGQVMGLPSRAVMGFGAVTLVEDGGQPSGQPSGSPTEATTGASGSVDPDAPAAAVRILVNPVTAGALSTSQATLLLTHEAVHVATAALGPPPAGRHWLSEGLAEWVALGSVPDQLEMVGDIAGDECLATAGRPGVPSDADLAADPPAARRAYATAWTIVAELAAEQGSDAVIAAASGWSGLSSEQPDELAARWCAARMS